MKFLLVITITLISLLSTSMAKNFDHSYKNYASLLSKVQKSKGQQSLVNYQILHRDSKELDSVANSFSAVTKSQFDSFTKDQRLSFLINAYNLFTIKLIVKHYPVKSIKKIGSLFTSAWKKKFFVLLGEETYLDYIEHDLIRKKFNEPRIHFAVVCASISCPNLQPTPFTEINLEDLLRLSAKEFLNDPNKNSISKNQKELKLSKIFKWYGNDFIKKYGSFQSYISTRITSDKTTAKEIKDEKLKIKWNDYDWDLNQW